MTMLARWTHRLRWAHLVPWAMAAVTWSRFGAPRKRFADVLRPAGALPAPAAGAPGPGPSSVAAAVRWATKIPPFRSTCIVRSVVLARMLRRYGYPAQVVIGLDERGRHAQKRFAHAWVECGPGGGSTGYAELVRLEL